MDIEIIKGTFSICKTNNIDTINMCGDFLFVARTDEEISIVCRSNRVPVGLTDRSDDWKAFRVKGQLDFSMTGILSSISAVLAKNNISIFAISTYNTDYILIKEKDFSRAVELVRQTGGAQ